MLWLLQEELAASAPLLNVFSEWSIVKLTGVRVTLLAAALICWKGVFESCHPAFFSIHLMLILQMFRELKWKIVLKIASGSSK